MEEIWRELTNFFLVSRYCGSHGFEPGGCGLPLAVTVFLVLAVLLPFGWMLKRALRNRRQRIMSERLTRAHLAKETEIANELAMGRLRWNEDKLAGASLTEAQLAEQIREGLKSRKTNQMPVDAPGQPAR